MTKSKVLVNVSLSLPFLVLAGSIFGAEPKSPLAKDAKSQLEILAGDRAIVQVPLAQTPATGAYLCRVKVAKIEAPYAIPEAPAFYLDSAAGFVYTMRLSARDGQGLYTAQDPVFVLQIGDGGRLAGWTHPATGLNSADRTALEPESGKTAATFHYTAAHN